MDHSPKAIHEDTSTATTVRMGAFHWSAQGDILWFQSWVPQGESDYIGACIGLLLMSLLSRGLAAFEIYIVAWSLRQYHTRIVTRQPRSSPKRNDWLPYPTPQYPQILHRDAEKVDYGDHVPTATEPPNIQSTQNDTTLFSSSSSAYSRSLSKPSVPPFMWRTDLTRSVIATLVSLVNYLLMLAVMTANGGFLVAILVGTFVGEMVFGRFRSLSGYDTDHSH